MHTEIIRTWQDLASQQNCSAEIQSSLAVNPGSEIELTDAHLEFIYGGQNTAGYNTNPVQISSPASNTAGYNANPLQINSPGSNTAGYNTNPVQINSPGWLGDTGYYADGDDIAWR